MINGKVLITGGAGYIGSELVKLLLKSNYSVTVLDLLIFGNNLEKHPGLNVYKGDVHDIDFFRNHVKGHDVVIHLAFMSNDPNYIVPTNVTNDFNTRNMDAIVSTSIENGVKKFIFASSCSVYGKQSESGISEQSNANPLTQYAEDKLVCENIIKKYLENDFQIALLRPATVFGPSLRFRSELSFNKMICKALKNDTISVKNPSSIRPNIYIQDMINLYKIFIEKDLTQHNGEVWNIAFNNRTLLESAKIIQEHTNNKKELMIIGNNDLRSYNISSNKLVSFLGMTNGAFSDLEAGIKGINDSSLCVQESTESIEGYSKFLSDKS